MRRSMSESATRCVIVGNMRRVIGELQRTGGELGGESPASCVTGDEHGGESPASCGTGGEHEAASMSRWHTHGEGVGGAVLIEASSQGGNRRDKMALAAVCVLHRRHRRP